jgi:hypothetical protein
MIMSEKIKVMKDFIKVKGRCSDITDTEFCKLCPVGGDQHECFAPLILERAKIFVEKYDVCTMIKDMLK